VVNKADPDNKKEMHNFTTLWEREELTAEELMKLVAVDGHAFCTGFLKEGPDGYSYKNHENFIGSQIVAIDIDNTIAHRKKTIEEGYYPLEDAFKDSRVNECASFVYTTPSHTEDHHRFRIVYLLPNFMNDKEKFANLVAAMVEAFADDKAPKSVCQGFYGSKDAKVKYFGKLLPPDEVDHLVESYAQQSENYTIHSIDKEGMDSSKFHLEDFDEILK
jgi:hypothetical protein